MARGIRDDPMVDELTIQDSIKTLSELQVFVLILF